MEIEFANVFLKKADEDLKSAEILYKHKIYSNALYFAQQAAEKAGKALLIIYGKYVPEHLISDVVMTLINEVSDDLEDKIEKIAEVLFKLEKYWLKSRYPLKKGDKIWDPTREYTPDEVAKAMNMSREVINTVKDIIKDIR